MFVLLQFDLWFPECRSLVKMFVAWHPSDSCLGESDFLSSVKSLETQESSWVVILNAIIRCQMMSGITHKLRLSRWISGFVFERLNWSRHVHGQFSTAYEVRDCIFASNDAHMFYIHLHLYLLFWFFCYLYVCPYPSLKKNRVQVVLCGKWT